MYAVRGVTKVEHVYVLRTGRVPSQEAEKTAGDDETTPGVEIGNLVYVFIKPGKINDSAEGITTPPRATGLGTARTIWAT